MGSSDGETFRGNLSSEGVIKLRDTVKEKLKDFLGDYTDDTLVEYVIVLLKNGRRKEEAKNELDVFLGDDSDPFISWLWDHLGSNLHLYVQSSLPPAEVIRPNVTAQEPDVSAVKNVSLKLEPRLEKEESKELFKTHHPKELKGPEGDVNGHRTLKSSIAVCSRPVEDRHRKVDGVKRSDSLQEGSQRKRFRPEDSASIKRDEVQQPAIAAPRRLLQFAVRDALTKVRPSNLVRESSVKRLRSVVSTASEDSPLEEQSECRPLVEKVSNNVPEAIVVDAAKYVKRVRPSRNVFDRLGRSADVSDMSKKLTDFGADFAGDIRGRPGSEIREDYLTYPKVQYMEEKASDMALSHRDTEMAFDPESKYDIYVDNDDVRRRQVVHVPTNGEFVRNKVDDPLMFQYNAHGSVQKTRTDQDQLFPVPDTAHKAVNISAGMNTWKSPRYQETRVTMKLDNQKSELGSNALNVANTKNEPTIVGKGNMKSNVDINKEPQKMQMLAPGLSSTGPPSEDAESRTIFVSNVHFAATKDSLSRHFNKCGEVLKVLILTDPATGLPKGSACVEFMKIEAAENALSLDGTSFMSRILKVVKKSSASPEVASALTWAPTMRTFPFPASGFGMTPFPRGVSNAYRGRPFKPGTRSLQWKRDAPSQMSNPASSTVAPRGLTYVRMENNANGSSTDA